MISKTGSSAVFDYHEGGVIVADSGPIGGTRRQAATVGDDENPSFSVVTDDHLTGADCTIDHTSSGAGDIEHHLVRAVGNLAARSEEHTSELQSLRHLVCRLLLEKKKKN